MYRSGASDDVVDPDPGTVIAAEDAAFGWRQGRNGVGKGRYFTDHLSFLCGTALHRKSGLENQPH